ncbi:retrovirus-related pol polyprotein from transposon TNT 1-94 [Tanacetum coccineum]
MEKDSKIYRGKKERVKSIALKAKKESSDDETSTSERDDEEYAMAVRNFKKFFRRKGKFVRQPREEKKSSDKEMRRKERVARNVLDAVIQIISLAIVQNHLATKIKRPSLKVLGVIEKMTPKTKPTMKLVSRLNRQMRDLLEKEILELDEKIKKLERSKEIEIACLGFDDSKASTSGTKNMSFVGSSAEKATEESTIKVHGSTLPGSACLRTCLEPDEWTKDSGCSKHMTGNKSLFSTYKAYDGEHVDNLAFNLTLGNEIRKNGLYVMKLGNKSQDKLCLATVVDNSTLWHRRLGHVNMRLIQSLSSKELVRNLPKLKYDKHFCDACKIGKQAHASHKAKNMVSTKRCLELLHMDLFGPSAIKSYGGNLYTLVVVDDYSRYTWTRFLKTKNEAFEKFEILSRKIQNQLGSSIIAIRTDHGREFDNEVQFGAYCDAQGITHNFSAPLEESLNVTFDESRPPTKLSPMVDDDVVEEEAIRKNTKIVNTNNEEDESIEVDEIINIKESKNHPLDQVIGNINQRM